MTAKNAPDFREYDAFFDTLYKKPTNVKEHHIFECNKDATNIQSTTTLIKKRSDVADNSIRTNLTVDEHETPMNRATRVKMPVPLSKKPGLQTIKKVELSKKFKHVVPPEYRDRPLYNAPTDEELSAFEDEKRQKDAEKKAKKRQRDH